MRPARAAAARSTISAAGLSKAALIRIPGSGRQATLRRTDGRTLELENPISLEKGIWEALRAIARTNIARASGLT